MHRPVDTRLVIGPNASLTERGAWLFMGLVTSVGLVIALWFTLKGFWPILPFAGLELAAVGAALWVTQRRNRYREVLSFEDDTLRIEFGLAGRGAGSVVEMSRAWARVLLVAGVHRHDPNRLLLQCSGLRVEVGRSLTDEERERLAGRINELLMPAWRQAPAGMGGTEHRGTVDFGR